jgi:hypothetical protein
MIYADRDEETTEESMLDAIAEAITNYDEPTPIEQVSNWGDRIDVTAIDGARYTIRITRH